MRDPGTLKAFDDGLRRLLDNVIAKAQGKEGDFPPDGMATPENLSWTLRDFVLCAPPGQVWLDLYCGLFASPLRVSMPPDMARKLAKGLDDNAAACMAESA